jgi:hypothetical protein
MQTTTHLTLRCERGMAGHHHALVVHYAISTVVQVYRTGCHALLVFFLPSESRSAGARWTVQRALRSDGNAVAVSVMTLLRKATALC